MSKANGNAAHAIRAIGRSFMARNSYNEYWGRLLLARVRQKSAGYGVECRGTREQFKHQTTSLLLEGPAKGGLSLRFFKGLRGLKETGAGSWVCRKAVTTVPSRWLRRL